MLITALALALSILNFVPLPIAMLGGAAAMVVCGCLGMDDFYAAVEWQVIFLVAGMLPLSLAITDSGLAERVGALLVSALSGAGGLAVVAGMALLTMLGRPGHRRAGNGAAGGTVGDQRGAANGRGRAGDGCCCGDGLQHGFPDADSASGEHIDDGTWRLQVQRPFRSSARG